MRRKWEFLFEKVPLKYFKQITHANLKGKNISHMHIQYRHHDIVLGQFECFHHVKLEE